MARLASHLLLPLLLGACQGAGGPAPGPPAGAAIDPACAALVGAAPAAWGERIPPVLARGAGASSGLVAALRRNPDGAGAQAAVAVLGRLGDPGARPFLEDLLRQGGEPAIEAALALGSLPATASVPLLVERAQDRLADPTLRAACAAALIQLGHGQRVLDLVRALVLAGSPAGRPWAEAVGLPAKPRWALERHMLLAALRRAAPEEEFGFDTDSPWPDLERAAERIARWLESR